MYIQVRQQIQEVFVRLIEELLASWKIICKSKKYVQTDVRSPYQINIPSTDWRIICILKSCLQIKELAIDWRNMCRLKNFLQIEELSADWKIIRRSKYYRQIEVPSASWRSVSSTDRRITCTSKNYLQSETICRLHNYLRPDWKTICRSKQYFICRSKNCLQIEELSADQSSICR